MESRRNLAGITADVQELIAARLGDATIVGSAHAELAALYNTLDFQTALANSVGETRPQNEGESKARITACLLRIENAVDDATFNLTEVLTTDDNDAGITANPRTKYLIDDTRKGSLLAENHARATASPAPAVAAPAPAPVAAPVAAPTAIITAAMVEAAIDTKIDAGRVTLKNLLTDEAETIRRKLSDDKFTTDTAAKEKIEQLIERTTRIYDEDELADYLETSLGIVNTPPATTVNEIVRSNLAILNDKLEAMERSVAAEPNTAEKLSAALSPLLDPQRNDVLSLLEKNKEAVINKLTHLEDVDDDNTATTQAADLTTDLLNATDKNELAIRLQNLGISPSSLTTDEMNSILKRNREDALQRVEANLPRETDIVVDGKELPLYSRKAQREYKKQHPGFLLKKSFEQEIELLQKNSDLVNTLAKRAEASKYTASQPGTQADIEKLSKTAHEKQVQLTQLKASCEIRKLSTESKSQITKFESLIHRIDTMLQTLKDTQDSIALARTLAHRPQTETVIAGTDYGTFTNKADAETFIRGDSGISNVGGLSTGSASSKTKPLLTDTTKFDAIKRITMVGDYRMVTGSIQTVKNPGTKNESYHQEILADAQMMSSRHGLRPNNLPADHTMEWAIDEITRFVNLSKNSGKPIQITTGGMHKYQVEALMIVCAAQNLVYTLPEGDPVKISQKDLDKRVEKAKKHPTYGLKLQSTEELANTSNSLRRGR